VAATAQAAKRWRARKHQSGVRKAKKKPWLGDKHLTRRGSPQRAQANARCGGGLNDSCGGKMARRKSRREKTRQRRRGGGSVARIIRGSMTKRR